MGSSVPHHGSLGPCSLDAERRPISESTTPADDDGSEVEGADGDPYSLADQRLAFEQPQVHGQSDAAKTGPGIDEVWSPVLECKGLQPGKDDHNHGHPESISLVERLGATCSANTK